MTFIESGPYTQRSNAAGTPNLQHRIPGVRQNTSSAPHTPEVVRVQTSGKSAEYENHRRVESGGSLGAREGRSASSTYKNNQSGDKGISFADEKVMESAQKFIQKYPNATLLVTADIHSNKLDKGKDKILYEPEPDYDSDDEKSTSTKTSKNIHSSSGGKLNMSMEGPRNIVADSSSVVRQNKSSVTVISVTSDANRESNKQIPSSHSSPRLINSAKSSPASIHMHENVTLTSPVQSLSSSRRSSGVVMATPSQPSSAGSSRRSSIQSNYSGDAGDKNGKTHISNTKHALEAEIPPPPPPPPPINATGKSSSPGGSANSTLRHRPNEIGTVSSLQNRVSTEDILAAVAERRNRLETEGPRISDLKTLPTSECLIFSTFTFYFLY